MPRAGLMRHRVEVWEQTTETDEWGQPKQIKQCLIKNLPAEVRDIRGREYWVQQQVPTGEVTIQVRTRAHPELPPGSSRHLFVKFGERWLEVVALRDPYGRNRDLDIDCREVS